MSTPKKELATQYKEREVTGGIFAIRNTATGRILLDSTADLQGSENRFLFSQKTGFCIHMKLQQDWATYGAGGFTFVVLEPLKKGNAQTDAEFKADLSVLKELWLERLCDENRY